MEKYALVNKIIDTIYFFKELRKFKKRLSSNGIGFLVPTQLEFDRQEADELKSLFNFYGSDKSSHHDYHEVYARIVGGKERNEVQKILEIGIGSSDISVPQNMGAHGIPGASLRAFRDWAPKALIIGADIDSKTMFTEPRITTVQIDQLDLDSFKTLKEVVSQNLNLAVIDGLHNPRADINSLVGIYPLMLEGGTIVVEDIAPKAAHLLWRIGVLYLTGLVSVNLEKRKNGYLFILKKPFTNQPNILN